MSYELLREKLDAHAAYAAARQLMDRPPIPITMYCDEVAALLADAESLRAAVRALAAVNAWVNFGECRAWGPERILSPSEADAMARRVLGRPDAAA